jgi:hypothetical protein
MAGGVGRSVGLPVAWAALPGPHDADVGVLSGVGSRRFGVVVEVSVVAFLKGRGKAGCRRLHGCQAGSAE